MHAFQDWHMPLQHYNVFTRALPPQQGIKVKWRYGRFQFLKIWAAISRPTFIFQLWKFFFVLQLVPHLSWAQLDLSVRFFQWVLAGECQRLVAFHTLMERAMTFNLRSGQGPASGPTRESNYISPRVRSLTSLHLLCAQYVIKEGMLFYYGKLCGKYTFIQSKLSPILQAHAQISYC